MCVAMMASYYFDLIDGKILQTLKVSCVEKEGFKTVKVQERIRTKWWDTFPLSLVTNNLWPHELRDERLLEFQLERRQQVGEGQLLDRANSLRGNVYRDTITVPIR